MASSSRYDSQTRVNDIAASRIRHHRNLLRFWILSCLALLITVPLASILIGRLLIRDFQYKNLSAPFDGRTVVVEAMLLNADPVAGVMTLDWTIIGEETSQCNAHNLAACSGVNVFFDNNLLNPSGPLGEVPTSNRPSTPIFIHNATAFISRDIFANAPIFRTELALFPQSSTTYYPFERYSAKISMFAEDALDNSTIGLKIATIRGIAIDFDANAMTRANALIPPGFIDVIITLQRGNLVKVYCIVVVIAIWLTTLTILVAVLSSVFFHFRQRSNILVMPIVTLFAFTQLRSSMPGAPNGFGDILDYVGFLPCLAILSLLVALTIGSSILHDPTDAPQTLTWDLMFEAFPALDPTGHRHRRERHTVDTEKEEDTPRFLQA